MLEQATKGQRGRADAGLQPGRVEVIGLPAEGRAQAVERTSEVLGLGAGQRRFPRAVADGHGANGDPTADELSPGVTGTMALNDLAYKTTPGSLELAPARTVLDQAG